VDLLFELGALPLGDARRVRLGLADHRVGPLLGLTDHLLRLDPRLGDGLVGRLLREHERALDDVGVGTADRRRSGCGRWRGLHHRRGLWRGRRCRGCRALRPTGPELVHLVLEVLDRRGGPLEELVDVVAVVAAPRLADLDVAQLLRGHVHGCHKHPMLATRTPRVTRPPLATQEGPDVATNRQLL
jgi:hypothetical protein